MSEWRKQAIIIIDDLISNYEIKRIFEVGCDDGGISRNLAKRYPNIEFYGIDYREDKILEANSLKNQSCLNNVKFNYEYFLNIKEIDFQYDLVIFTEVYEHLVAENQIYSLRLLGNFLVNEGFLVFTCPNGDYMFSYLESEKKFSKRYKKGFFDNMYQTEHWLEPSHKEIKKIFVALGLDIFLSGYFNLPKRRFLIVEKFEALLNKVPIIRNLFFKSQFLVARKNSNSPLLKKLDLYDEL